MTTTCETNAQFASAASRMTSVFGICTPHSYPQHAI